MKRALSVLLMVCILCGTLPTTIQAQELPVHGVDSENDTISGGDNNSYQEIPDEEPPEIETVSGSDILGPDLLNADLTPVTRIQWLHELTTLFEMTVEEDNYPDNYYSDITSSSNYYYDVMLATEFGLIDVEAGEAFHPDLPATREFTSHTLNLCLGYSLDDKSYTFSEAGQVTYPDDIQVAINRGWFLLKDGAFSPDLPITIEEKDFMLTDAREAQNAIVIQQDHNNTYEFQEGITVLPDNIEVVLTDESELTITKCPVTLKEGDKFGIVSFGLPVAYKVISLNNVGDKTVIKTERLDTEEAFKKIDVQGEIGVDLAQVQTFDDSVELRYIVGGKEENDWEDGIRYDSLEEVADQEISVVEAVQSYDIPDVLRDAYQIGEGVKAEIVCKISNVSTHFKVNSQGVYFDVNAKVNFACNVSVDLLEDLGIVPSYNLAYVPIAGIGYMKITLDLSLKGKIILSMEENIGAGIYYKFGDGFRIVTSFTKTAFTIQMKAEASAGIKFSIGLNCGILEGSIYGKAGGKASVEVKNYTDGSPAQCMHVGAWLYASIGIKVEVNLLVVKAKWEEEKKFFDKNNSPVRVYYHYEDGIPVSVCTRDRDIEGSLRVYKYYTPADSRYGYNGASSGTGANGEVYTIFNYDLDNEGNATITSYQGNVSALSIPDSLDGHTVVGISQNVFKNNQQLRVVNIPDSIIKIGVGAFESCINLTSVVLSRNLTELGTCAFRNCKLLTQIEIPKSLKKIKIPMFSDKGVFWGCENLKNILFEEGITEIPNCLFANCPGIEKVIIPNTVTKIADSAFENCASLLQVTFSDNITEIGDYGFCKCTKLQTLQLPSELVKLGAGAFEQCNSLTEIYIPKSLKTVKSKYIGGYSISIGYPIGEGPLNNAGAFAFCEKLKSVSFEEGITAIPSYIFAHCESIEKVEIPYTVTNIGTQAFDHCENIKELTLHSGLSVIGNCAFGNCYNLEKVVIPDSVTTIKQWAFANCKLLYNVELPKKVTLEGGAFCYCKSLTNVTIPKTVNATKPIYLGGYNQGKNLNNGGPFMYCENLQDINWEKDIASIPNYLFSYCYGIKKIEIPGTVIAIGDQSFDKCINLGIVTLNNGTERFGDDVFTSCSSLKEIYLPDSINYMGSNIFSDCTNLEKVKLPKGIINISEGMFKKCSSLTTVEIPQNVQSISGYVFQNSGIRSIIVTEKVQTIGEYAFNSCDELTDILIPDSVNHLGTYIFADCEKLSDIKLGTGLTDIPSYAFSQCPSLTKIVLPYSLKTIKDNAFLNCVKLTEITVPRAITNISDSAFSYTNKMTFYGISGTYAEEYANRVNAKFVNQEVNATKLSLNKTDLTLNKGQSFNLSMTVTPADFTDEVTWRSSDTAIATVSDNGMVTAKGVGSATIRLTVGKLNASCKITVLQPVTNITLNKTSLSLECEDTYTLTARVSPSDASNKEVIWSSSVKEVAEVNKDGLITAKAKGETVVTAAAVDGSGILRTCTVTVLNNVYKVRQIGEFESPHPYSSKCSDSWIYTLDGAKRLTVTFSPQTEVEEDFDFLYLYDKSGKEIGKYTGRQLAGNTISLEGDTIRVKLVSDEQTNTYGFAVTDIKAGKEDVEEKFTDISTGAWYVSAVQYAYDNDIMKGKDDNSFAPNGNLTRAEFAAVLHNLEAKPEVAYRAIFSDVKKGQWYTSPILWVYDNRIASGYPNGSYGISDKIQREQLALMLYKYARLRGYNMSYQTDVLTKFADRSQISSWAEEALQWAVSKGIMSGKGNVSEPQNYRLDPKGNATRAECASMMKKLLTLAE